MESVMSARLPQIDLEAARHLFVAQGAFIHHERFLTAETTQRLVAAVADVADSVNRNYLPGHKQGGSISRHRLDAVAPGFGQLYRSPALLAWLNQLTGEKLQPAPATDPHAYALYFYTRPGDHIGWHYDTSYYRGRRYTLLFGLIDESSCRLEYELHTRERGVRPVAGSVRLAPGDLVVFDGDKLRHRITPLGKDERRVSLTFEYVTDPRMHPWWRLISNMKDAVAYFGLRQVFGQAGRERR
jgi:alkylated DNA repair dioxygenase AlkB